MRGWIWIFGWRTGSRRTREADENFPGSLRALLVWKKKVFENIYIRMAYHMRRQPKKEHYKPFGRRQVREIMDKCNKFQSNAKIEQATVDFWYNLTRQNCFILLSVYICFTFCVYRLCPVCFSHHPLNPLTPLTFSSRVGMNGTSACIPWFIRTLSHRDPPLFLRYHPSPKAHAMTRVSCCISAWIALLQYTILDSVKSCLFKSRIF